MISARRGGPPSDGPVPALPGPARRRSRMPRRSNPWRSVIDPSATLLRAPRHSRPARSRPSPVIDPSVTRLRPSRHSRPARPPMVGDHGTGAGRGSSSAACLPLASLRPNLRLASCSAARSVGPRPAQPVWSAPACCAVPDSAGCFPTSTSPPTWRSLSPSGPAAPICSWRAAARSADTPPPSYSVHRAGTRSRRSISWCPAGRTAPIRASRSTEGSSFRRAHHRRDRTRRHRRRRRDPVPWGGPVERVVVTAARRTAYDLACRLPLVEAVVAVDALANVHRFEPAVIDDVRRRHLGARGSAHLTEVVRVANRLSDSPMETRIRLVIVFDGLPEPVLQHPVGPYFLDMAYPVIRLAVEYDGKNHRSQELARATSPGRPTSAERAGRSSASPPSRCSAARGRSPQRSAAN